ncbi:MAG TPA: Ku protein [Methylomirabilota bacterium]|nr:Ku protein [Methylomirabilota bacterium]
MPPHAIGSGTISFGLVSIPVKLYTATSGGTVSFNLLHAKCGSRIRQQTFCPTCNAVVDRNELVRGYEFAKDQYVRVGDDELKALEGEASKTIDITEFVPLEKVDPIYFERTYYLGPDKGGEKAYRLLANAMGKSGRVALAKFVMRGKESLVLIRSAQDGLMLHTMYFTDEVRSFGEIDKGKTAPVRPNEMELAQQLIDGLTNDEFHPEQYQDEYRGRVLDLVNRKVEGREVTVAAPPAPKAQVIDLMEALRESLAKRVPAAEAREAAAARKPPSKAVPKRAEPARAAPRKAQGGRK